MQPTIISISGAGGSGQTTLQQGLEELYPGSKFLSITTRPPRQGEKHGVDYRFIEPAEFADIDDLMWQTKDERSGVQYGASKTDLEQALNSSGLAVICLIPEFQEKIEEAVTPYFTTPIRFLRVHLLSPSKIEQTRRLTDRGDNVLNIQQKVEAAEMIDETAKRLAQGELEIQLIPPQSISDTANQVLRLLHST